MLLTEQTRIIKEAYKCDACERQESTGGGLPPGWTHVIGDVHVCSDCATIQVVANLLDAICKDHKRWL